MPISPNRHFLVLSLRRYSKLTIAILNVRDSKHSPFARYISSNREKIHKKMRNETINNVMKLWCAVQVYTYMTTYYIYKIK